MWEDTENYDEVETALVIDDSGSMDWNDGENQRLTVAGELIDRLPDGSRIGVVKFESSTTLLTEEFTTGKILHLDGDSCLGNKNSLLA